MVLVNGPLGGTYVIRVEPLLIGLLALYKRGSRETPSPFHYVRTQGEV